MYKPTTVLIKAEVAVEIFYSEFEEFTVNSHTWGAVFKLNQTHFLSLVPLGGWLSSA